MKIFICFGYNEDDKWIKQYVFPLVESFNAEVITGEDLPGEKLTNTVTDRILNSDGVLGFLTRRNKLQNGLYMSHPWVHDELATAYAHNIPAVPIIEAMVDKQLGIGYDRQRIDFDLNNKAHAIVEIVKTLNKWKRKLETRQLILLPKNLIEKVSEYIDTPKLTCSYNFIFGKGQLSMNYPGTIIETSEGDLMVYIKNIPTDDARVRITIIAPAIYWISGYALCNSLPLTLRS